MKSKLYIVAMFLITTLVSCTSKIESLEDLKNADLEQNPELINGFRLGVYPNLENLELNKYKITYGHAIPNYYCKKCNTWYLQHALEFFEPHSFEYILNEEFSKYIKPLKDKPRVVPTDNPLVFYVLTDGKYLRTVNTDELVHFDDSGNSFEEGQPFVSFNHFGETLVIDKFKNIDDGVFSSCYLFSSESNKSVINELNLSFKSVNNPPISRLVYNGEGQNDFYYQEGQVVNIDDRNFEELYENCSETFITALNEKEVKQVIKYFEQKFGARKYDSKNYSGDFNRKPGTTFYRSYRWTKGVVNISLVIDDYPPENKMGVDKENPYIKQKGYSATAVFTFNDEVQKMLKKWK